MTWFATVAAVVAAGLQYKNTQDTAKRQDQSAADAIRSQSLIQKDADSRVNTEVQKLQGSNSSDAAASRLDDYLNVLRTKKAQTDNGLTPNVGSSAFQADSGAAANDVNNYATKTAGLLSRIDAPQMQRQQEAFSYGNLGTDLNVLGRQSQGQSFLDQLRLNGIRRNAKIDLASGLLSAAGGAMGGMGGGQTPDYYSQGKTVRMPSGFTVNMPNTRG